MSKYCFDTSAILDAWVRAYPPDIMPDLWDKLAEMINNDEIICCKDVYNELEKRMMIFLTGVKSVKINFWN